MPEQNLYYFELSRDCRETLTAVVELPAGRHPDTLSNDEKDEIYEQLLDSGVDWVPDNEARPRLLDCYPIEPVPPASVIEAMEDTCLVSLVPDEDDDTDAE